MVSFFTRMNFESIEYPIIFAVTKSSTKNHTMKKLFIAAILIATAQTASSQIYKGQWLVGGNAGFETGKFGDADATKYTSVFLNPNAGYFFINNLAGGLRLSLESTKYKVNDDATSSFLFAPFVRYYFLPAAQRVNVFADGSFGIGSMNDGDGESFNQYSIMAGPAIFLTPNTALEFALQYRSSGGDAYGGDDRQNNFGLNIGFQVHLGNAGK